MAGETAKIIGKSDKMKGSLICSKIGGEENAKETGIHVSD
jgi:hypothetical protein